MFSFVKLSALLVLVPFVCSAPTSVEERATIDTSSHCGMHTRLFRDTPGPSVNFFLPGLFDSVTAGTYSLLLDQWGASGASSGTDCANLVSLSGTTLAWKTTWTWTGQRHFLQYIFLDLILL